MTPLVPKSGAQHDQIAPTLAVASSATTACGMLGRYAATRSPGPHPEGAQLGGQRGNLRGQLGPGHLGGLTALAHATIAGSPTARLAAARSRFSAQFSRAPGNQRAPGMSRSASAAVGGAEAVTAKCAQIEPPEPVEVVRPTSAIGRRSRRNADRAPARASAGTRSSGWPEPDPATVPTTARVLCRQSVCLKSSCWPPSPTSTLITGLPPATVRPAPKPGGFLVRRARWRAVRLSLPSISPNPEGAP